MNEQLVNSVARLLRIIAKDFSKQLFDKFLEDDATQEDKDNLMKAFMLTLAVENNLTHIIKEEI